MKILLVDNGMTLDFNTPYVQLLGGSETSILLLSKGLAELGHQVVLLTNNNVNRMQNGNRILDSVNLFDGYAEISDVIILNRFIPQSINSFKDKKIFFYSHDAYDQAGIQWLRQPNIEKFFNKIFCVSEWQKQTFVKYFNCDDDYFEVIGNPIDYSLHYGHVERQENRLIFASIPYKGLKFLPDLFTDICIKSKKKLELQVFSSFQLYGRPEEDESYGEIFKKLNGMNDVVLNNPISMKGLAYEFMKSSLLIHPSTYAETFGRVFVEAMASGCLPVTVNNGANKEVIEDNGFVLGFPNIENIKCYEAFVDKTCELLDSDLYGKRVKAKDNMKKFNYINISRKVESYLGE